MAVGGWGSMVMVVVVNPIKNRSSRESSHFRGCFGLSNETIKSQKSIMRNRSRCSKKEDLEEKVLRLKYLIPICLVQFQGRMYQVVIRVNLLTSLQHV